MKVKFSTASLIRPNDTTAYAANDVIAAVTTPLTLPFSGFGLFSGAGYEISTATLISSAAVGTKLEADLLLFSSNITDIDNDNAAFTPTDAQLLTLVGSISFLSASGKPGDATSGADGNAFCFASNLKIVSNYDTLYGVLVARNAYVPVASEVITIKLGAIQNYNHH